jgi:acyl-CoA thioesterase FadM
MEDFSEKLMSRLPVTIRRRVRFGDCDPAGVVYTPVFAEYGVSAFNWLMDVLFAAPLRQISEQLGFATPFRAMSFDFRNALWPDQMFDMICTISDIRSRTFDIDLLAIDLDRKDVFVARITPIFVARTEWRSIPIPPQVRARLEDYRRDCRALKDAVAQR